MGKPDGTGKRTGKGTATEDSNRKGDRAGKQTQGKTKESMKARVVSTHMRGNEINTAVNIETRPIHLLIIQKHITVTNECLFVCTFKVVSFKCYFES